MLDSAMEKSFLHGDNTGMTATDTQKNMVRPGGTWLRLTGQRVVLPTFCAPPPLSYPRGLPLTYTSFFPLVFPLSAQVYVIGQRMSRPCSPEEYGIALAKAFIDKYPLVSKAKVLVEEQPWRRVVVDGAPHEHGFSMEGTAVRTAYVTVDRQGRTEVTSGALAPQIAVTRAQSAGAKSGDCRRRDRFSES